MRTGINWVCFMIQRLHLRKNLARWLFSALTRLSWLNVPTWCPKRISWRHVPKCLRISRKLPENHFNELKFGLGMMQPNVPTTPDFLCGVWRRLGRHMRLPMPWFSGSYDVTLAQMPNWCQLWYLGSCLHVPIIRCLSGRSTHGVYLVSSLEWNRKEIFKGKNHTFDVRLKLNDLNCTVQHLCIFLTTLLHPHGHWQIKELLGNQYYYLRLACLDQPDLP